MKRYFLYRFFDQNKAYYCLVDNQTNTRTTIRNNVLEIFTDKLPCIYPIKNISDRHHNIIANAESIKELLYCNPELLV